MSTNKDNALDLLEAHIESMTDLQDKLSVPWERVRSDELDTLLIRANRALTETIATFNAIIEQVCKMDDQGEVIISDDSDVIIFPDEV